MRVNNAFARALLMIAAYFIGKILTERLLGVVNSCSWYQLICQTQNGWIALGGGVLLALIAGWYMRGGKKK